MDKSSKKSAALVESAPASTTKTLKKGKRNAEHDLDIQVPKKQKKELIDVVQKEKDAKMAQKDKLETSSSDSSDFSDSEGNQKKEDSSSQEESSDEESAATKKLADKNDSLKSTTEGSPSSDESSLDRTSSDEKSNEEESEDAIVIPKTKNHDSDTEMVDTEQKSNAKQPKKPITQTQRETKTLYVGNLPFKVEKSDVKNFFKEVGRVVKIRLSTREDGSNKGYGHVEFSFPKAARKALSLNGRLLLGREIKLELAHKKSAFSNVVGNFQRGGEESPILTIYVKGFHSSSLGENEIKNALRAHFSTCGKVTRIVVPKTRNTGVITGNAYIYMEYGFHKALQLNGSKVAGCKIVVQKARPRDGLCSDRFSNNGFERSVDDCPGRASGGSRSSRRGLTKPSLIAFFNKPNIIAYASSQGKRIIFDDDDDDEE